MLFVTKIFHFEMAHAIHGYDGPCKHIHGHSYVLEVTVTAHSDDNAYLKETGFIVDFKDLKKIVSDTIVHRYDHKLVLSKEYMDENPAFSEAENLIIWDFEPSAENIILYFKNELNAILSEEMQLSKLKLYETSSSYAEWIK
ncbi:MAG: 6-carboxytetrahydropterin synthase [Sphingobacteriales bacterium]|nr:6-carboxytetrahydropterin synthase [Sphingobacteriales bacterium]